jgi:hypothetical protein
LLGGCAGDAGCFGGCKRILDNFNAQDDDLNNSAKVIDNDNDSL